VTYPACPTPRKRAYDRKSVALRAADHLAKRFECRPYWCVCMRWHLTTRGGRNDHRRARGQVSA
jgi:hypothetical protein